MWFCSIDFAKEDAIRRNRCRPATLVLIGVIGFRQTISADELSLTNGRTLRGIIARETPQIVVVDLGVGTTTLARDRIASIHRASPEENRDLRRQWKETYFLHRRYVPAGQRELANAYKTLQGQRNDAVRARLTLDEAQRAVAYGGRRIRELQNRLLTVSRRLKEASPEQDMDAYNALVRESNALRAEITLMQDKVATARSRFESGAQPIASYLQALSAFTERFRRLRRTVTPRDAPREAQFLARLEPKVAQLTDELDRHVVPSLRKAGGLYVETTLNGQIQTTLLVDTGAALMALPERLAAQLGVQKELLPVQRMTVADGRTVQGRALVLDSVTVGDARAEDVAAVLLPSTGTARHDGLLGMSFLRNFAIRIDASSGNLVLSDFRPRD